MKESKRSIRFTIYLMLFLALSIGSSLRVFAQGSDPTDDDVNKVAKQLYCPVCESTPLDVCPTEACRQWRELIRQMLAEGKSEDEIKQYFVVQYGARVLANPPNPVATYLVPVTAFLLGAFLLYRGFKMWLKPSKVAAGVGEEEADPIPQDEYIQRMEEELKKRK
jgi:cytochrome c-type biogenesis protein CcmH